MKEIMTEKEIHQYKELEKKLGIEPITLLRAVLDGIYCVKCSVAIGYFLCHVDVKLDSNCLIDDDEESYSFEEYGKTWALTREEIK